MVLGFLVHVALLAVLTLLLGLFSYVYRLYAEDEYRSSPRAREHLQYFREQVGPRLKLERPRAAQVFSLLTQFTLVAVALVILGAVRPFARSALQAALETALFVVLELLLMYLFLPYVLLSRTGGRWLLPLVPVLRGFGYLAAAVLFLAEFLVSVLHLAEEEEEPEPEAPAEAIAHLVEQGQERGILRQDDIPLIASVIQFADKTAREVMTPRPEVVGIAASASIAELRRQIRERRFSRIPVYGSSLDDLKGVVFVRDVLEVPEAEAEQHRVGELMRPALFVPETMPVVEVARQLQAERQEMAVVVDEYGNVAGLITLEDLAEEIIGEISDADQVRRAEVVKEADGQYLVRGGLELERLRASLGVPLEGAGATTFAGLVHGWFGHVPKPGEVLERDGLRVEVLESTPRRVVRLRVHVLTQPEAGPAPRKRSRKKQPAR